ncbi:MFS transporter [Devosia submarina]|uniref:MFS transporter n=1 Tax=Devosia submarina TaxID=1173082 RepID=UPI000D38B23E|nr:MFS transporter [Devosia submarina]
MLQSIRPIIPVLASVAILMLGNGALSTLIGLRMTNTGASSIAVGAVTAAFFGGLTFGSLQCFRFIKQAGHIRAFAAFASLYSAASLGHAISPDMVVWSMLRFAEGVCLAGIYMCIESWLNDQASNETRGQIVSSYMVTLYAAMALGQQLLNLNATGSPLLFMVVSILLSLSLVPVCLTRITAPSLPDVSSFSLRALYRASPLGLVGVLLSGGVIGAIYGLAPVYAASSGFGMTGTATFMTLLITGGVLLQFPLGRLSDIFDRRTIIIAVSASLALLSLLMFAAQYGTWLFLLTTLLFGGISFSIYPLCLAHTNDHVAKADLVAASGGLILLNSIGSILGPLIASAAMAAMGPRGLFAFSFATGLAATAFGIWRTRARPAPSAEDQALFRALPQTTPVLAPLHAEADDQGAPNATG